MMSEMITRADINITKNNTDATDSSIEYPSNIDIAATKSNETMKKNQRRKSLLKSTTSFLQIMKLPFFIATTQP